MLEGLNEYLKVKNLESGATGMNTGARAMVPLSKASPDIKCKDGIFIHLLIPRPRIGNASAGIFRLISLTLE